MIERMKRVIAQVEQLPEDAQEALAEAWEVELSEREWVKILQKPQVRSALRRMADEALAEHAAGETEEWP